MNAAMAVLGMLELPEEDQPPMEIWHHQERLNEWFAAMKQRREDRMKGVEMEPIDDNDDDPTMTGNSLTEQFKAQLK